MIAAQIEYYNNFNTTISLSADCEIANVWSWSHTQPGLIGTYFSIMVQFQSNGFYFGKSFVVNIELLLFLVVLHLFLLVLSGTMFKLVDTHFSYLAKYQMGTLPANVLLVQPDHVVSGAHSSLLYQTIFWYNQIVDSYSQSLVLAQQTLSYWSFLLLNSHVFVGLTYLLTTQLGTPSFTSLLVDVLIGWPYSSLLYPS